MLFHRRHGEFRTFLDAARAPTAKGGDAQKGNVGRPPGQEVGKANSAPSLTPDGQRAITVLVLV